MRKFKINGKTVFAVPKALRRRFDLRSAFISPNGRQSFEFDWRTGALSWLPVEFTQHFRACCRVPE